MSFTYAQRKVSMFDNWYVNENVRQTGEKCAKFTNSHPTTKHILVDTIITDAINLRENAN